MKALNATGKPNVNEYVLGRGRLLISAINATSGKPVGGWRDMGNFPEITLTFETESTDHKSSRTGKSTTDTTINFGSTASGSLTLENITLENAALFFSGEITHPTQGNTISGGAVPSNAGDGITVIAGPSSPGIVTAGNIAAGESPETRYWPLYSSDWGENDTPETLLGKEMRRITVTDGCELKVYHEDASGGGSPTFTDITSSVEIDTDAGTLFIPSGAVSSWADADRIIIAAVDTSSPTGEVAYQVPSRMSLYTKTTEKYAVRFLGENPQDNDEEYGYHYHQVQFTPNGDFNLITEQDLQALPLNFTIERSDAVDSNSPFGYALATVPA